MLFLEELQSTVQNSTMHEGSFCTAHIDVISSNNDTTVRAKLLTRKRGGDEIDGIFSKMRQAKTETVVESEVKDDYDIPSYINM